MIIQYITNARIPTEKAHGIQIAKACAAFAKQGNEVTLIVPTRRTPITASVFEYYGVPQNFAIKKIFALDTVKWGALGFLIETFSFAVSAARVAQKDECIYGRDEIVLAMLLFFGAKKVVWESHDGAWNRFATYVAGRARAVVVVTEGAKAFYMERGVPEEKLLFVPNGVDLADFAHPQSKEEARKRLGLPTDRKVALYIGRLDGWKGTDTLLAASSGLTGGILAVIGGEQRQIERLKKTYPSVFFLGYKPYTELADNQAAADVLVVPNTAKSDISVRFTSPLKLIAHLAAHRAIVASDLPSIREIGRDAVFYIPPDDAHALAKGIETLWSDEALASSLAEKAHALVSGYDWNIRAERILALIEPEP